MKTTSYFSLGRPHARRLLFSSLGSVLIAFSGASLLGQPILTPAATTPAKADEVITLDAYTITGIRGGLTTGIRNKQKADVILDAISTEDVGKFPDRNIAESLQRITGVQIERSNGEGTRVSVRGLDPKFNSIKFNGRTLTSASSSSRDFNFLLLQPEFVEALEVFKSSSADMEEGALSATINVRTLRPLDLGQRRIVANAETLYEGNSQKTTPRFSMIYSDVFMDKRLGVMVGAGFSRREIENHRFQAYGFQQSTEADNKLDYTVDGDFNDTVRYEHAAYFQMDRVRRDRSNGVASLQFKASDELMIYADALYAKLKNTGDSPPEALRFTNTLGPVVSSTLQTIDGTVFLTAMNADGVDYRNNNRYTEETEKTLSYASGFEWKRGGFKLKGEASHSDSKHVATDLGLEVISRASAHYSITGPRDSIPVIGFDRGYNRLDPKNYYAYGLNGRVAEPNTDKNSDYRLDATQDLNWGILTSIQFGAKYSKREHFQDSRFYNISAQTLAPLIGGTYDPVYAWVNAAKFMTMVSPTTSFLNGAGNSSWLVSDTQLLYKSVSRSTLLASTPLTQFKNAIFGVDEEVLAGYVRANFKGSLFSIPYSGNVGVRAPRTKQVSTGYAPDLSKIIFSQQGATTSVPNVEATTVERTYSNVLPSANIAFTLDPKWVLRGAAARVMARPDLGLLSTGTSVNANVLSITANNPYLNPYKADQYDLSLEWYPKRGTLLSAAAFYKKIDSFVANVNTPRTLTVIQDTGGTRNMTFSYFSPTNGKGTNLDGVELAYQQQFTFLPKPFDGFGVIANYTFVESGNITSVSGGPAQPLTGVSKNNYNLVAYFENSRFGVRLAYNFRDSFLIDPSSYFGDGESVNKYATLDATFNLKLTEVLSLTASASNLTNAVQKRVSNQGFLRLYEENGRRFTLSVRAAF